MEKKGRLSFFCKGREKKGRESTNKKEFSKQRKTRGEGEEALFS